MLSTTFDFSDSLSPVVRFLLVVIILILVTVVSGVLTHKAASIVSILVCLLFIVVVSSLIIRVLSCHACCVRAELIDKVTLCIPSTLVVLVLESIEAL